VGPGRVIRDHIYHQERITSRDWIFKLKTGIVRVNNCPSSPRHLISMTALVEEKTYHEGRAAASVYHVKVSGLFRGPEIVVVVGQERVGA